MSSSLKIHGDVHQVSRRNLAFAILRQMSCVTKDQGSLEEKGVKIKILLQYILFYFTGLLCRI